AMLVLHEHSGSVRRWRHEFARYRTFLFQFEHVEKDQLSEARNAEIMRPATNPEWRAPQVEGENRHSGSRGHAIRHVLPGHRVPNELGSLIAYGDGIAFVGGDDRATMSAGTRGESVNVEILHAGDDVQDECIFARPADLVREAAVVTTSAGARIPNRYSLHSGDLLPF